MLLLHVPGATPVATTIWDFLLAWQFEPLVLFPLLLLGFAYVSGSRSLARLSHRVGGHSSARTWFFAAGYTALVVALLSPLHTFSEELFFMHMIQHVLLMSVAAPLLLLGNPISAGIWGLPGKWRLLAGHALASDSVLLKLLGVVTHPFVAWWVFTLNLWLWHQPAAYEAALASEVVHHLQHILFFLAAVIFWWPVIGPAPLRSRVRYPLRMIYVFLTWLPNSILGAGFTFAPAPLMSFYQSRPQHWGIDPLTDQQLAGLIMWIPGDAIYAAAMMVLLLVILHQEDRRESRAAAAFQS